MTLPAGTQQTIDDLARAGDWDGLRAILKAAAAALEAEGARRAQATSDTHARFINDELGAYQVKACRDADVSPSGFVPAVDELLPALAVGAARGQVVLLGACDCQRYENLIHAFVGLQPVRPGPVHYVTSLHLGRLEQGRAVQEALRRAWPELA